MIAVGSLALSQQDSQEPLDSLQQYSQILPELKSALTSGEEPASDGVFLTHFLMLIYEVYAPLGDFALTDIFLDCYRRRGTSKYLASSYLDLVESYATKTPTIWW